MKLFCLIFACSIFLLSCAHHGKNSPAVSPLPSEEKTAQAPAQEAPVGAMNASLKGYRQIRAAGVVHIVPDPGQLHIEVMLEGLKPGPYKINLTPAKTCKSANASHGRDLGEVIVDGKGTAKANFDFSDLPATDVIGKKVIIYTKEKRRTQVAACGVVEKL